ncbi:hypothetical protein HUJ04_003250 [Dendroctonus ponderosae]|nr:hypothetical protein HUJ04_003250 [Dendroctonus ponderosae]
MGRKRVRITQPSQKSQDPQFPRMHGLPKLQNCTQSPFERQTFLIIFTDIPLNEFLEATKLTLTSTYFLFNNNYYQQIEGCAMGSSISSVVDQLVLEQLEPSVINKLSFKLPSFFRRNFNPIKNIIKTIWYTKQTWSNKYLNFKSQHSFCKKKSVVMGIVDRAITLTDPEFRHSTIEKAEQVLLTNDCPPAMISKIFKNRIYKFYNNEQNKKSKTKPDQYLTIRYDVPNYNYTKLKDKIKYTRKSNVVYEIPCNNCDGKYIGQTSQLLKNRLNGHKDQENKTALAKHIIETGHTFNYTETKVLKSEFNTRKRKLYETIEIIKNLNGINFKTDTKHLSIIYNAILA